MNIKKMRSILLGGPALACLLAFACQAGAAAAPRFKMVVLAELKEDGKGPADDQHRPYVEAARIWLNQLAKDSNFTVTYLETPDTFTDSMLAGVDLIWQMNYAPYGWPAGPKAAFEKYMNSGKGGWLGVHHATLYGGAVTNLTWPFFFKLIGQINFKGYISKFASGNVRVEEASHPIFAGVPASFNVATEEWYTWDSNPRKHVHVLGNVDESSYKFNDAGESGIKMGDHPVIWTNDSVKTRNLYIFMGHHPNLFDNPAYVTLIKNSLFWVVNKPGTTAADKPLEKPVAKGAAAFKLEARADKQFISFTTGKEKATGVTLLDASGHSLFHAEGDQVTGSIDRTQWGAGAYILRATTAAGQSIQGLELR